MVLSRRVRKRPPRQAFKDIYITKRPSHQSPSYKTQAKEEEVSKSSECTLSELDLFTVPMTQLSIEDKIYSEILPIAALTDGGPVEFYVPGDGEKYLDLNDTLLLLRVKITNDDGSPLPDGAATGLINYPINTIFSQCDVVLGDRLISQSSATHPYRAIIETLLNFSEASLKSQFSAGLFFKDTAANALYPLSRITVKTYSIPQNSRICNLENLFLGAIPKYIVLGLVDHEAYTGRRDLSPFNFRHMNVEYLALSRDGKQIPSKAFQPTFYQGTSVREFYNLFTATSRQLKDLPLSINRLEYQQGYTLFAFNLNTAGDSEALSPVSTGNLRMEMRFGEPLRATATLIVYACYDSILEINSKREVLVDYY
uniref:Uncharacterized protein n=2 Tax=Nothobranchius rachovii TaxID=451742 RepID=A0A1A8NQ47_9TELE